MRGRFRLLTGSRSLLSVSPSTLCYRYFTSEKEPHERHDDGTTKKESIDDTMEWANQLAEQSVRSGNQSEKSADYFKALLKDRPEMKSLLREARQMLDGQDPEAFTSYQRNQFANRISMKVSKVASETLMKAHAEESATKRHTQDGSPTGENYWFEAGNTLGSPGVPGFVKDEIFEEMQKDRAVDSPAFEVPPQEEEMAHADAKYAEHLRKKKKQLFSGTDL